MAVWDPKDFLRKRMQNSRFIADARTMDNPDSCTRRHVFRFLVLPYHIRDNIYSLILRYPDVRPAFDRFERSLHEVEEQEVKAGQPKCVLPVPRTSPGFMQTPALLLVNRQIAAEAVLALRDTPLVLSRYAPYARTLARPMDITEFVGEETLRKLKYVVLRVDLFGDARAWCKTAEMLLDTWTTANCLKSVTVWAREMTVDGVVVHWDRDFEMWAVRTLSKVWICLHTLRF